VTRHRNDLLITATRQLERQERADRLRVAALAVFIAGVLLLSQLGA
jgi:hypothetical protein